MRLDASVHDLFGSRYLSRACGIVRFPGRSGWWCSRKRSTLLRQPAVLHGTYTRLEPAAGFEPFHQFGGDTSGGTR